MNPDTEDAYWAYLPSKRQLALGFVAIIAIVSVPGWYVLWSVTLTGLPFDIVAILALTTICPATLTVVVARQLKYGNYSKVLFSIVLATGLALGWITHLSFGVG